MLNRQMIWVFCFGFLSVILTCYIILIMPPEDEVRNLGIFLFKLTPFICAALAISLLDPNIISRFHLTIPLVFLCFAGFFFVYVPRMFFEVFYNEAEGLYYKTLIVVPFVILSLTLAFRLGGGGTGTTLRIAFGLLLLMISGLEDLAYLIINPHPPGKWNPIPEIWEWPSHMIVRIGHAPTKYEAYAFIIFHVTLAFIVAFHPMRFMMKLAPIFGLSKKDI